MEGIFRHRPHNGNGQVEASIPPEHIEKRVELYFSKIGEGLEPKPNSDEYMNPAQLEVLHRNYLLARSSYEVEGLSENLPMLYVAPDNADGNIGNLLNERLGDTLDATFKDKKEEVKRSTTWILAMIALRGGIEYKKFDNFGDVQYSLGLNHGDLRPTNNNIADALYGLIGAGYVAQGQKEGPIKDGKPILIPLLVATAKLDPYLKQPEISTSQ